MAPFRVEFIRFSRDGQEALVVRRELQAETMFDAEREALRVKDEDDAPMAVQFDAAFLHCEGARLRRYERNAEGVARWGRA